MRLCRMQEVMEPLSLITSPACSDPFHLYRRWGAEGRGQGEQRMGLQ